MTLKIQCVTQTRSCGIICTQTRCRPSRLTHKAQSHLGIFILSHLNSTCSTVLHLWVSEAFRRWCNWFMDSRCNNSVSSRFAQKPTHASREFLHDMRKCLHCLILETLDSLNLPVTSHQHLCSTCFSDGVQIIAASEQIFVSETRERLAVASQSDETADKQQISSQNWMF